MRTPNDYKVTPETDLRKEVIELHLFNNDAREEEALCGAKTSAHERIGVDYYLDQRKKGIPVGTVCEWCKALAVPFAESLIRDLDDDGRMDEAGNYRLLAHTLLREIGPGPSSGQESEPLNHVYGPFCVSARTVPHLHVCGSFVVPGNPSEGAAARIPGSSPPKSPWRRTPRHLTTRAHGTGDWPGADIAPGHFAHL